MARTPKPPKIDNHPNFIQRLIMIFGGGFLFIVGPAIWMFGFLTLGVRATIDRLTLDYLVSFVFFSLLVTILYYAASPAVWVKTFETITQSNKFKLITNIAISCFLAGVVMMAGILVPWNIIAENIGGLPDLETNGPLAFSLFSCGVLVTLAYLLLKGLPNEPPEDTNGTFDDFMRYHYDGFLHFIGLGRFAPKAKIIETSPVSKKAAHAGNDGAFDFDPAAFGADPQPNAKSESKTTSAGSAPDSDENPKPANYGTKSKAVEVYQMRYLHSRVEKTRDYARKKLIEMGEALPEKGQGKSWPPSPLDERLYIADYAPDDLTPAERKEVYEYARKIGADLNSLPKLVEMVQLDNTTSPSIPRGVDQRRPEDAKLWAIIDDPAASDQERKTALEKLLNRKGSPKRLPPA